MATTERRAQPDAQGVGQRSSRLGVLLRNTPLIHRVLIVMACVIVYANTLSAPLVFDDMLYIVNNPTLRDWGLFARAQTTDVQGLSKNFLIPFRARVVALFTFALDYRIHGTDPFGFHLVNLLIHISACLALYWLLSMLLHAPRGQIGADEFTPRWAPLFASLLFATHPLQTQAVTYVSQRFSSLSTLFYLLALALYVRSRLGHKRALPMYILSALMALLAVRTKETALTLPVAMALVEVCFLVSWREIKLWRLVPWVLIAMVIPVSLLWQRGGADIAGAANAANVGYVSMWDYFLTGQRVMVTYLRLLIAPINQNIDYDYPTYHSLFQGAVLGSMLIHAGLLWLAVHLYGRARREGMGYLRWGAFGIAWFYLALSVESSFIPLGDMIEEYRMYLPLAGVCMAVAVLGAHWARTRPRVFVAVAVCVVVALTAASIARNQLWRDPVTLWQDTVNKSPNKARAYNNLGVAYSAASNDVQALGAFYNAVAVDPTFAQGNLNLANTLRDKEQYAEALKHYEVALYLRPKDYSILNQMGVYYMRTGKPKQAEDYFNQAIEANPYNALTYNNMGSLYREQGRCDKAMGFFEEALRLNPEMAEARYNIGTCLMDNEQYDAAIKELSAAVGLDPKLADAQVNLGMAYLKSGQSLLASERFKSALELEQSAEVMTDLADAYQSMGESAKSEEYYLMAIKADPALAQARFNYILLLARQGRRDDALAQISALKNLSPERVERLMSDPMMREFLAGKGQQDFR